MPLVDRPHNARALSPIERGRGLDGEGQGVLFKSWRPDAAAALIKLGLIKTAFLGSCP